MADEKPPEDKPAFDPFKPAEPVLPGVPAKKPAGAAAAAAPARASAIDPVWLAGGAGIALVVFLLAWWVMRPSQPEPAPAASAAPPVTEPAPSLPAAQPAAEPDKPPPPPPVILNSLPGEVATVEELKQPWDSKKFLLNLVTGRTQALLIRLPGGSPRNASAYWGLLMQAPYGRCELEYITDLQKLTDDYGFRASHPMVGDPCSRSVFDPTRYGSIGGVMARGEVVQGTAIRPPLGVQIAVQGNKLMALRTE
jgi:hypothetical protein